MLSFCSNIKLLLTFLTRVHFDDTDFSPKNLFHSTSKRHNFNFWIHHFIDMTTWWKDKQQFHDTKNWKTSRKNKNSKCLIVHRHQTSFASEKRHQRNSKCRKFFYKMLRFQESQIWKFIKYICSKAIFDETF